MNQITLTPEQVKTVGALSPFNGLMTITNVYRKPGVYEHDFARIVIARGSEITGEFNIFLDGRVEALA